MNRTNWSDIGCFTDEILTNNSGFSTIKMTESLFWKVTTRAIYGYKHGYAPEDMLMSTVVPIPQNKKKSLNDSNYYRGIALSSIIGKVLELLILNSNRDILRSCDLQFGFKSKHSTTQCTLNISIIKILMFLS